MENRKNKGSMGVHKHSKTPNRVAIGSFAHFYSLRAQSVCIDQFDFILRSGKIRGDPNTYFVA